MSRILVVDDERDVVLLIKFLLAKDGHEILEAYLPYIEKELANGVPLHAMVRHTLGLFQGMPGARAWRRHISENAHKKGAGVDVVRSAADKVRPANIYRAA